MEMLMLHILVLQLLILSLPRLLLNLEMKMGNYYIRLVPQPYMMLFKKILIQQKMLVQNML